MTLAVTVVRARLGGLTLARILHLNGVGQLALEMAGRMAEFRSITNSRPPGLSESTSSSDRFSAI